MNVPLLTQLEIVKNNPTKTAKVIAETLSTTRQSASRKLNGWVNENLLTVSRKGRSTRYELVEQIEHFTFDLSEELDEFRVYLDILAPKLKKVSQNVQEIFQYGFTEMFNNAIDHSCGAEIVVEIRQSSVSTSISIADNGVGIFEKIQSAFELADIRQSIFELSKGKLTTDKVNHSGEGVFFSSKVFDFFSISSKGWKFVSNKGDVDILCESDTDYINGTKVTFELSHLSDKKTKEVFDQFAMPDEFLFATTIVSVNLAREENDFLMSRSQAKRIVARFEHFQKVILDFQGVSSIGQGFSDQIFRVFQNAHPNVQLQIINATENVKNMIKRVGFQI